VLRIFIAFKNPFPSAGFERANLGSNDKHANHYTTEVTNVGFTVHQTDKSEIVFG
jgi:hypothetical protein